MQQPEISIHPLIGRLQYKIGDITYIVKAVVKDGVKEDAATKVRRLIHNDLKREKSPV